MRRNYGIDLLRIVSTYGIFIAHILGWGGILNALVPGTMKYLAAWTLEMLVFTSINTYALISGYVGVEAKYKVSSIVLLFVHTIYHTIAITTLFSLFSAEGVTISDWLNAFFPGMRNQYWYLTAYLALFIVIPFLNVFINANARMWKTVIAILFIMFSIYPTVAVGDIFNLNLGYSGLWLIILYIVGAMIRKSQIEVKNKYTICVYIVCVVLSVVGICYLDKKDYIFTFYSPTIFIASICLLLIYAKIEPGKIASRIIKIVSPTTFFLYAVHAQPLVWNRIMHDRFVFLAEKRNIYMVLGVLMCAAGGFSFCFILDEIRVFFFKVTGIDKGIKDICQKVQDRYK